MLVWVVGLSRLFQRLRERTATAKNGFIATVPTDASARATVQFLSQFSDTVGDPALQSDAQTAVRRLRTTDPTMFGYFRDYWWKAHELLVRTDRSYVQAGQLTAKTPLSARILGATLSAFTELGALSVRSNTNGPNRYNCRNYDPKRAAELGLTVESLSD